MNHTILQRQIETALLQLSQEFLDDPYRYFTEADAVSRCRQLLELNDELGKDYRTKDGHRIRLIHQEYPTIFRYAGDQPLIETPEGRRGHYDLVVLNPDFIEANSAESITNRLLKNSVPDQERSFVAVFEFKLSYRGWNSGAYKNVTKDLQKLAASKAKLTYAVMLMRYNAPSMRRWDMYWPLICEEIGKPSMTGVRSIYTVHWLKTQTNKRNIYWFGQWQALKDK